jgi:hypothetical protein
MIALECPECGQGVEVAVVCEAWCSKCRGRPRLEEVGKSEARTAEAVQASFPVYARRRP